MTLAIAGLAVSTYVQTLFHILFHSLDWISHSIPGLSCSMSPTMHEVRINPSSVYCLCWIIYASFPTDARSILRLEPSFHSLHGLEMRSEIMTKITEFVVTWLIGPWSLNPSDHWAKSALLPCLPLWNSWAVEFPQTFDGLNKRDIF